MRSMKSFSLRTFIHTRNNFKLKPFQINAPFFRRSSGFNHLSLYPRFYSGELINKSELPKEFSTNVPKYRSSLSIFKSFKPTNNIHTVTNIIQNIREHLKKNPEENPYKICQFMVDKSIAIAQEQNKRKCNLAEASVLLFEELHPYLSFQDKRKHSELIIPVIKHYSKFNDTEKVLELYQRITSIISKPHHKILYHVIQSICTISHREKLLEIKESIISNKRKNSKIYEALFSAFRKLKMEQELKILLRDMKELNIEPTANIYCYLIYDENQNQERALSLFKELKKKGIKPQIRHYTALLQSSKHINREQINDLLSKLKDQELQPDMQFFNQLIRLLLRQGDIKEALILIKELPQYKIKPNSRTYSELMQYYAANKDWDSFKTILQAAQRNPESIDLYFLGNYISLLQSHGHFTYEILLVIVKIIAGNRIELKGRLLVALAKYFKSISALPQLDLFLGELRMLGVNVDSEIIIEFVINMILSMKSISPFHEERIKQFLKLQAENLDPVSNQIYLPVLYLIARRYSGENLLAELNKFVKEYPDIVLRRGLQRLIFCAQERSDQAILREQLPVLFKLKKIDPSKK